MAGSSDAGSPNGGDRKTCSTDRGKIWLLNAAGTGDTSPWRLWAAWIRLSHLTRV